MYFKILFFKCISFCSIMSSSCFSFCWTAWLCAFFISHHSPNQWFWIFTLFVNYERVVKETDRDTWGISQLNSIFLSLSLSASPQLSQIDFAIEQQLCFFAIGGVVHGSCCVIRRCMEPGGKRGKNRNLIYYN